MDNSALIESFTEFKEFKKIDRLTLTAILEEVFRTALKKKYGTDDNFNIVVNPDKGDLQIWRNRIVVEDGAVEDPAAQIPLSEARKIQDDFEVGEEVSEEVKIMDLGRRAILALRQNLVARIFEYDNATIFKRFEALKGTIITGEVHHVRPKMTIVHDEYQNELVLPREEQIAKEHYKRGDQIQAIIIDVRKDVRGPQVVVSRSHPELVRKLFEREVPELVSGAVSIMAIAREAGARTKIAVKANTDGVNPKGALIGPGGARVRAVMENLGPEKIDIVDYSDDPAKFVAAALSPAVATGVQVISEKNKTAIAFIHDDQLSLAIGKEGQNARLAAKLTGWKIGIESAEAHAKKVAAEKAAQAAAEAAAPEAE